MAATKKNGAWRAALAEGSRRRWARLPREPRKTVQLYQSDVDVLRSLVQWPEVGTSPALTLRALLAASRGVLWKMGRDGRPKPTASLYGPLMGHGTP